MRYIVAIVAFLGASGVYAQNSTTCTTLGNVTNCQHQPGMAAPLDYGKALGVESYETQRLKRAQADALELQSRAEQERLACRKKALKAIDAGEYEKAKALATLCP